jgi:hypothetical protein
MKAHDIFNEVLRLGLSPIVLTGRVDSVKQSLTLFLAKTYCEDQFVVYDNLTAENIDDFIKVLSVRKSPILFTLIDSRGVTARAWQKILKSLEDNTSNSSVLFLSDGNIPKAIETRCFRCHVPATVEVEGHSGTGSFAVGSWIIGVDYRNREQLIKCCQGWTPDSTDLLIRELGGIITGDSVLKIPVVRLENDKIMYALNNLSKYRDVPTAALSTGLRLIV